MPPERPTATPSEMRTDTPSQTADDADNAVRRYYGETLRATADLRTDACCDATAVPDRAKPLLARIHRDVTARYYGCGTVLPEAIGGATVLDLGCGTGRDVYLLAQLVGPEGRVIGVDMTPEQLATARETLPWHQAAFGAACPQIEFHDGLIERLDALPIAPGSVDVIVSNCVVNLSPDKAAVLRGAARLLKPGGEMHFADVYADREIPPALRDDPVIKGECLGGALTPSDFAALAEAAGFHAPRLLTHRPLGISDAEIAAKLGGIRFVSATYRLFRGAEPRAADGATMAATARYLGSMAEAEGHFTLDHGTRLTAGERVAVDHDAARILRSARFAAHFDVSDIDGPAPARPGSDPFGAGSNPDLAGCCG